MISTTSNLKLNQLQKLKHNRLFMILMIMSLLVILFWISISIFTSHKESKLPSDILELTVPLNPAIDRALLGVIEKKRGLSKDELADFPIYKIITDENIGGERVVTIDTTKEDLLPTPTPTPTLSPTTVPTLIPTLTPTISPLPTETTSPAANPESIRKDVVAHND